MANIITRLKDKTVHRPDAAYDIVVIGSGSGMLIVENAIASGLKVALIDEGPAGGTCLNVGCIPSKMLIAVADRIMEIRESGRFGIKATVTGIDFNKIMKEMKKTVIPDHQMIHEGLLKDTRMDYYEGRGQFLDAHRIETGGKVISGEKIFVASGARPLIPSVEGIDTIDYLTNETLLQLESLPESLAIIGGGYIAAEYGHFFSALGTDVTIIQRADRIIPSEDPEVSELLASELKGRMVVKTGTTVESVRRSDSGCELTVADNRTREKERIGASHVLIAAGRRSNADRLAVDQAGVETDAHGFIVTNDYLETSRDHIWAFGDANGRQMFTHVANAEADAAWHNAMHAEKQPIDYRSAPRAVFTWPPIAAVGLTESEARQAGDIFVGRAAYDAAAKGMALREDRGFGKVIVDRETLRILGFHIIGPYAPMLIQEVVNAMALGGEPGLLFSGMHIHPAMNELIAKTFSNLE